MKLSYFNTMEDFEEGSKLLCRAKFSSSSKGFILLVIIIPLLGIILSVDSLLNGDTYTGVVLIFIAVLAFLGLYFITPRLAIKTNSFITRRNKLLINQLSIERNLVVYEEEMSFISKNNKKTIKFFEVKRVVEENSRIFVISNKNIVEAIIPFSVFASLEEKNKFINIIGTNNKDR